MVSSFMRLWIFELRQLLRSGGEWAYPGLFMLMVTSIFPLSLSADPELLKKVGTGIIWSAAALGSLLLLPRLFEQDVADGTLEQYLVAPVTMGEVAAAKLMAYWQVLGLGLGLACWPMGVLYGYNIPQSLWFSGTVVIGTGGLVAVGLVISALSVFTSQRRWLQLLLALPLYIPLLIFGSASGTHMLVDVELATREALILTGLVIILIPVAVPVTGYLLQHSLED